MGAGAGAGAGVVVVVGVLRCCCCCAAAVLLPPPPPPPPLLLLLLPLGGNSRPSSQCRRSVTSYAAVLPLPDGTPPLPPPPLLLLLLPLSGLSLSDKFSTTRSPCHDCEQCNQQPDESFVSLAGSGCSLQTSRSRGRPAGAAGAGAGAEAYFFGAARARAPRPKTWPAWCSACRPRWRVRTCSSSSTPCSPSRTRSPTTDKDLQVIKDLFCKLSQFAAELGEAGARLAVTGSPGPCSPALARWQVRFPLPLREAFAIVDYEPLRGSACRRLVGGVRRESARSRPGGRRPRDIACAAVVGLDLVSRPSRYTNFQFLAIFSIRYTNFPSFRG